MIDGDVAAVVWARSRRFDDRSWAIDPDRAGELIDEQLRTGVIGADIDLTRCRVTPGSGTLPVGDPNRRSTAYAPRHDQRAAGIAASLGATDHQEPGDRGGGRRSACC